MVFGGAISIIPPKDDPLAVLQNLCYDRASSPENIVVENSIEQHCTEALSTPSALVAEFSSRTVHIGTSQTQTHGSSLEEIQARLANLHQSVSDCDAVLRSIELYLDSFRQEISGVSAKIDYLQVRSTLLNEHLEARNILGQRLNTVLDPLIVVPNTVRALAFGAVDDAWHRALRDAEIGESEVVIQSRDGQRYQTSHLNKALIQRLVGKVVERTRDHIVAQIRALRSPHIDAQVIQQQKILPYKRAFKVLTTQAPQLGADLSRAYNATMSWYYSSHFSRYSSILRQLDLCFAHDASIVIMERSSKPTSLVLSSQNAFSLGQRSHILRGRSVDSFRYLLSGNQSDTHFIELLFYAFNLALVENISLEHLVLREFWNFESAKLLEQSFNELFSETLRHGSALTKHLISSTTDAFGILLCIRLNQLLAFELQRRRLPWLDGYINGTNMLLWPRYQSIMDSHCSAVRRAAANLPNRPAVNTFLTTTVAPQHPNLAPHPITQRFGSFLHGILVLSPDGRDDEPVSASLARLQSSFEEFIQKSSKIIPEPKSRTRYLFNNYALICTILSDVEGKLAESFKRQFEHVRDKLFLDGNNG